MILLIKLISKIFIFSFYVVVHLSHLSKFGFGLLAMVIVIVVVVILIVIISHVFITVFLLVILIILIGMILIIWIAILCRHMRISKYFKTTECQMAWIGVFNRHTGSWDPAISTIKCDPISPLIEKIRWRTFAFVSVDLDPEGLFFVLPLIVPKEHLNMGYIVFVLELSFPRWSIFILGGRAGARSRPDPRFSYIYILSNFDWAMSLICLTLGRILNVS